MSFFLVARTEEGALVLLSEQTFGSARAAQSHLSELSSDPAFPHFDDDVLVMDLDKGTPVLLVRPAGATPVAEDVEAQEETVVVIEEEADEAESEIEEVADEAIADEIVEEAGAEEEEATLKDALSRTAASMEAEGITPPESVGPAEQAEESAEASEPAEAEESTEAEESAELEEAAEAEEPAEAEQAAAEVAEPASEGGEGDEAAAWPWDASKESAEGPNVDLQEVEEQPSGMASELIIIDEGTSGSTEGGEIVTIPAEENEAEPASADEAPAADVAFELDDLEAPAVEASPLVSSGADDELLALSRPVILDADAIDSAFDSAIAEPMGADVAEGSGSDDISAFIRDLEQVTEIPEAAAPVEEEPEPVPEPAPSKGAMLPGVTCDDCVYEPTCPNKENRTPQQCGSFQWKTV